MVCNCELNCSSSSHCFISLPISSIGSCVLSVFLCIVVRIFAVGLDACICTGSVMIRVMSPILSNSPAPCLFTRCGFQIDGEPANSNRELPFIHPVAPFLIFWLMLCGNVSQFIVHCSFIVQMFAERNRIISDPTRCRCGARVSCYSSVFSF